ncbi:replication initiation and membrane attachment protein DnaB, putative [Carnobacterium sp. AT7]|mgnify:FL=1|uniref:replication initiation and membrane attachment family protein n=1 Tax=Carnobacterium TaxID=2747 RepID=UPI00015F1045|nr:MULTISPECIES: DnaD domain protein [Carnobacterium]EDP68011.1 replication initiation and membrane attachment protein DnaB, putative [Carnobacterium sp. AT7]
MGYPWKNLSPKDGFIVKQQALLSDIDQKILTFLYQPLIGTAAYSLYMTLWTEIEEEAYWSEGILHSELLALLNIGIPELYQARIKLEAIGLLKTYIQTGSTKLTIYELQAPQASDVFFKDDLLSLLLLEKVGERKFRKLRNRFVIESIDKKKFQEVTKSFLDVFQFDAELLKREKDLLKEPVSYIGKTSSSKPKIDSKTFDLKFFYTGLNQQYINRSSITKEVEEAILVLHTLYGLDELAMQQFVLNASDIETGQIDEKKLKKLAYDDYHNKNQQNISLKDVVEKDIQVDANQQKMRDNELTQRGLTIEDIAVIEVSEQISPIDFMNSIKDQKGGFVTKPEEWTLEEIVKKANLPTAVINILIHYILVVKNNPTLDQKLAYKIANDWAQEKVVAPEEAIQKVKKMYLENAEKRQQQENRTKTYAQNRNNGNYSKQVTTRKETLPEWAKAENKQAEEKPMSENEKQAFMERLKRIQNFGKEGE